MTSLVIDTCALLDLIRAPTRERFHPTYAASVLRFSAALRASSPDVKLIFADIVQQEYRRNVDNVVGETRKKLMQARDQYAQAMQVASAFSGELLPTSVDDAWIDKAVATGRQLADELAALATIEQATEADRARGGQRVFKAVPPSRLGKESFVDCVVTEIALRISGTGRTVFLSSNTDDYCDAGRLRSDLQAEFDAAGIQFASNWGQACAILSTPGP